MIQKIYLVLVLALLLPTMGCGDDDSPSSPTGPSSFQVEYRVSGTASQVIIRYANSEDGTSQVVTGLPWSFSVPVDRDSIFLSLEVQPALWTTTIAPFLSAQIFVDGRLVREVSSSSFSNPLQVSLTYRR